MKQRLLKFRVKSRMLMDVIREEHGQDLVEYAAVIALVVLGITTGMSTLAAGINTAMSNVSTKISSTLG
jgi:pilus assembly protein Flp/PilA